MKRVLTALVGVPLFVGLTWLGGWPFVAFIGVIALAGQKEAFELFEGDTALPGNLLGFLAALCMVVAPMWWPALWLIAPLGIGSLAWFLIRAPGGQPLMTLGGSVLGLVYPAAFLAALVMIRVPYRAVSWDPFVVTMGVVVLIWTCDTAAYYAGRILGKHKLAPSLSPRKTWEGAIGGGIGALAVGLLLALFWSGGLAMQHWLVLGGLAGTAGPVGDLFESALKRAAGTKDSASILPGHGGVLDRFDALAFVAPLAAAYLFGLA